MSNTTENWSNDWNSSTNPSKQRKYRDNAPLHVKDKLVSANLDHELREELGTRNLQVRTGDRVKVMRGDETGAEGIVNNIDRENTRIYVDGIEVERQDGSKSQKPLRPSNVQLVALNVEDISRIEKYDVEDIESIEVEEEEMEEALEEDEEDEMMQQMQGGESGAHEQFEEDEESEEETEEVEDSEDTADSETEADYEEVVSGTIGDGKDELQSMEDPDYEAALEAEKDNKNRTTFVDWLESKAEE
jgi:large subunit ribosomal protein L24